MDVSPRQNPAYRPSPGTGPDVSRGRIAWAVFLVVYAAGIFALSSFPIGEGATRLPFMRFDGLIHAAEFAVLFVLARQAMGTTAGALLTSIVYAGSDEWHQSFVTARTASIADFGFDVLGIFVAALVYAGFRRRRLLARRCRRILAIRASGKERGT